MGLAFESGHRQIWRQVLTSEVADPIGMRITGKDDDVADLVFVQVIEDSVAVGAVAVPGILQPPSHEQDRKRDILLCGLPRPLSR